MSNIDGNYRNSQGVKKGLFCQKSEVTFSYFLRKIVLFSS